MSKIEAKKRWNRTPFHVEDGKRYRFTSVGNWQDASHDCSATGYTADSLRRWEWLKRERNAKWFSVIGRIDKRRSTQFDIGRLIDTDEVYIATATGILFCFANDVWFMYWNNKGAIDIELHPVESE